MNISKEKLSLRWAYMVLGVVAMLFAGILYAWSILKSPLSAELGWGTSDLALNFTIAMTFYFCSCFTCRIHTQKAGSGCNISTTEKNGKNFR